MANVLTRAMNWLTNRAQAVEGQYRPGPYYLPISQGWLPDGSPWNYWQCGNDIIPTTAMSAMVEACIGAYAQTVAMLPGDHWAANDKNGRDRVTTSALFRILRSGPNEYESISDFLLSATRHLILNGNAYALAARNDRNEIVELHLCSPRSSGPSIAPESGAVFYHLAGNEIVEARFTPSYLGAVPARDVLHIRLNTDRNRLIGESPLLAALPDIATAGAITAQQYAYYLNAAKPSFALVTPPDRVLTEEQIKALRDAVQRQGTGGTLILNAGVKPEPIGTSGRDAQTAEIAKTADEHIALALGVPLQVLGVGGTVTDTESLMNFWLARGLGFVVNHIELAFDRLFGLRGQPEEYVEFDTSALLRSAHKARIDAAAAGIKGGVFTVNEARTEFQLGNVTDGDEIRVQAQDVPLSAWKEQQAQAAKPKPAAPALTETPPPAKETADDQVPPQRLRQLFRSGYQRQRAA
jgi:HK97 family phage portal protein